jgi:hypothetical protein
MFIYSFSDACSGKTGTEKLNKMEPVPQPVVLEQANRENDFQIRSFSRMVFLMVKQDVLFRGFRDDCSNEFPALCGLVGKKIRSPP